MFGVGPSPCRSMCDCPGARIFFLSPPSNDDDALCCPDVEVETLLLRRLLLLTLSSMPSTDLAASKLLNFDDDDDVVVVDVDVRLLRLFRLSLRPVSDIISLSCTILPSCYETTYPGHV
jgi:hypothetical protein